MCTLSICIRYSYVRFVQASSYMKQGKYNEAETLYKLILTRAFDMGVGAKSVKPLWQVAEDLEAGEANESEIFRDMSRPVASNESSAVASTLRNLAVLYRRQGKTVAAEFVEKVARVQVNENMAKVPPVTAAMTTSTYLPTSWVSHSGQAESETQENPSGMRRTGSFTNLKAQIRTKSARILQKIKTYTSPTTEALPSLGFKRSSSVQLLNNIADHLTGSRSVAQFGKTSSSEHLSGAAVDSY